VSILIVDDDREFAAMLAEGLSSAGFETRAANTVDEAVAIVRTEQVSVIVCDVQIQMRVRGGFEILEEVHSLDSAIPVVLMSSFGSTSDAERAQEAGASAFLCKPFHLRELVELTKSLLAAD
jgi:DNA-binding response OmpR family regulator